MGKPFHEIRCCGRKFTSKEWGEYCDASRKDSSKLIHTTIGKYTFNDCDMCLNPERIEFNIKKGGYYGYNAAIEYADCGNGLWAFGINYATGMGGGGYGVCWADRDTGDGWRRGYHTLDECLRAACDKILERLAHSSNNKGKQFNDLIGAVAEYRRSIGRPKVTQLELF